MAWQDEDGLEVRIVLVYDSNWEPPSQAYCKAFREEIGLTVPVLYDPTEATSIFVNPVDDKVHETTLVTNEEGVIAFKTHSDTEAAIIANVEAELAAELGQCSSANVCADGENCLPAPAGPGKLCATLCSVDENDCPDGQLCWSYGSATGACFDAELVNAASASD
ncbi:MAG: hypothetical protein VYE15_02765 [Myxococcota bacterium]|nr:hypothetical protein [Myxococcota bacterium]